ncbi:MAG: AAA family ATPase [Actinomycetia bacterium]|nr:AAA family ATPase [Actinomycetes bacterium]MCP4960394.1 AAA family ATPase [Actinomycetes bacterium]
MERIWAGPQPVGGGVLLERDREMGLILEALETTGHGAGSLVMIHGEAGIGKTHLAAEAARRAASLGLGVGWVRCWDGPGGSSLWPWEQVLAQVAPHLADEIVASSDIEGLKHLDSAGRFRLFDRIAGGLHAVAREQPLLLVFDDVQWADDATLDLLRFLSREIRGWPIVCLATHRPLTDPERSTARLIGSLTREGSHFELVALSRGGSRGLVHHVLGEIRAVSAKEIDEIHEASGGNPFFVGELARLLLVDAPGTTRSIPLAAGELISQRLEPLDARAVRLLQLAAVIGRDGSVEQLARTAGVAAAELQSDLRPAVDAELLSLDRSGWRFHHDLVREALYEQVETTRRRELHCDIARSLEADPLGAPIAVIAHHWGGAGNLADGEHLRRVALMAAADAESRRVFDEVVEHLELVLGADPRPRGRELGDLLVRLGSSAVVAGATDRARNALERAAAIAAEIGDPILLARASLAYPPGFEAIEAGPPTPDDRQVDMLRASLESLPPGHEGVRCRLEAGLARAIYWRSSGRVRSDDWEATTSERHRLTDRALERARSLNDPGLIAYCILARLYACWGPDSVDERPSLIEELFGLADGSDDLELLAHASAWSIGESFSRWRLEQAYGDLDRFDEIAHRLRQPLYDWMSLKWRACMAALEGRMDEADALAIAAVEAGVDAIGPDMAMDFYGAQLSHIRYQQGRLDELLPALEDLSHDRPQVPAWRFALVSSYAMTGRLDESAAHFAWAAHDEFAVVPRDLNYVISLANLSAYPLLAGDGDAARRLYEVLSPFSGHASSHGLGSAHWGTVDRLLGLLAGQMGRPDLCLHHLESAYRQTRSPRTVYGWVAEVDLGRALKESTDPSERARGDELLRSGRSLLSGLGLADWLSLLERFHDQRLPLGVTSATLCRDGIGWRVGIGADSPVLVADRNGMRYLHSLIGSPGEFIDVLDLELVFDSEPRSGTDGTNSIDSALHQDLIDHEARSRYRGRIRELEGDIERARRHHDEGRQALAEAELDRLVHELVQATGFGGRDRGMVREAERARVRVTKAIRSAIRQLEADAPAVAGHLRSTISTGRFCRYQPAAATPVVWELG